MQGRHAPEETDSPFNSPSPTGHNPEDPRDGSVEVLLNNDKPRSPNPTGSPGFARAGNCGAILAWTLWLGLAGGLVELIVLVLKCNYFDVGNYNASRHFPWMVPVAGVLVLLVPGLVLMLAARVCPGRVPTWLAVGLLAFPAILGILFRLPLYTLACLFLAAGAAVQGARLVKKHPQGAGRLVKWSIGPLAGFVLLAAAFTFGRAAWSAPLGSRFGAPPSVPKTKTETELKAKNVLLIVLDTVRAQSLSLYGYEHETTPRLDRLAARAVRFDRALSTAPWTAPSHAGMFTGRLPGELSIDWDRPLDRTHPTLAEFLASRGFQTAGFVANTTYCSYETGLDRGFRHYEDYDLSLRAFALCSGLVQRTADFVRRALGLSLDHLMIGQSERKDAARISRDFLTWLDNRRDQATPYFAFLNYYDAHHPYLPPSAGLEQTGEGDERPFLAANDSRLTSWWNYDKSELKPADIERVRASYDRCLRYLDDQVGRLFDALSRRAVLDNTLIIVTADHGEHLGEQDLYGHGCSLYRSELHVPLLLFVPSSPAQVQEPRVVPEPVSLRNLPATVVDFLGLSKDSPFPGQSLLPSPGTSRLEPNPGNLTVSEVIAPPKADPNQGRSPVNKGSMRSLVMDRWHYIRNGDGHEELYDFDTDPREEHDLATSPEQHEVLESLRAHAARLSVTPSR